MQRPVKADEVFGLIRPAIDAHTLGVSSVEQLLTECGYRVVLADAVLCDAANHPASVNNIALLEHWIRAEGITRLGFSYRLDPEDGAFTFGQLLYQMRERKLMAEQGGQIQAISLAGLPALCARVQREYDDQVEVFCGDETPAETLEKLGVPSTRIPAALTEEVAYDTMRMEFGRELLHSEKHFQVKPVNRTGYGGYGTARDLLVTRVRHGIANSLPPLMRAHVGPYLPEREKALTQFTDWTQTLAKSGLLDVLSIGTSQLSQSNFGEDWGDKRNGGGVPINSIAEFRAVWEAARPMLVRTYAGTRNLPQLAQMYEETIHTAWHALSFWWFSQIDGRGPYSVRENLEQHLDTLRFIAASGKPFEPNIPHHFAFRGADDVTYVVSAVLAARTAKAMGIPHLILQIMLNTPRATWGVQDLAKARAMLRLVRELEDNTFQVLIQPRAGLDYFSPDLEKAKVQLAAVTALMDDIEPRVASSPQIIHVVSYSEASHLADPAVVNESVQITRAALKEYRRLRQRGAVEDMTDNAEVQFRTEELLADARTVLAAMERTVPSLYTADGLYQVFAAGFLPVPYLWEGREEFAPATRWQTKVIKGSVKVVDAMGQTVPVAQRAEVAAEQTRLKDSLAA
jgi:hypothetical protein